MTARNPRPATWYPPASLTAPAGMRPGEAVALIADDIAPDLARVACLMAHDVHVAGTPRINGDRVHVVAEITPLSGVLDPILAARAHAEHRGEPQSPFALTLTASRMLEGMIEPFYHAACPLIEGDPTSEKIRDGLGMETTIRDTYLDGLLPMRDGEWIPWLGPAPIAFAVIEGARRITPKQAVTLARAALRALRPTRRRRSSQ